MYEFAPAGYLTIDAVGVFERANLTFATMPGMKRSEVVGKLLERLGYHVIEAQTGKEAIALARAFDGDINLAILDVFLPEMNGKKVYPLLKEFRPNLKVLVFSGYSLDGPAQEILDAGAHGFHQKPVSIEVPSAKLKELFQTR